MNFLKEVLIEASGFAFIMALFSLTGLLAYGVGEFFWILSKSYIVTISGVGISFLLICGFYSALGKRLLKKHGL
jgi:hypothetical protein